MPEPLDSLNVDGLDVRVGLRYLAGKAGLYISLLQKFVENYAGLPDDIRRFAASGEWDEVDRRVHSVKGLSGSMGAYRVHSMAESLENSLKNGKRNMETIEHFAEQLQQLHLNLRGALKTFSAKSPDQSAGSGKTGKELLSLLLQLKTPLANGQPVEARKTAEQIRQEKWPIECQKDVDVILDLSSRYRFIQALELLNGLTDRLFREGTSS